MKKILVVVLTVCVVFGAAAAFAQGHQNRNQNFDGHEQHQQMMKPQLPPKSGDFRPDFKRCLNPGFRPCRPEGKKPNFTPDMPTEIREKAAELAKLRVDLEEAMTSKPVNKAKALDTYKKMQLLENEIDVWRFEKRLERMEAMKKHHEERRNAFIEKMEKTEQKTESEPEKTEE